jgi:hypothetical protein
VHAILQSDGRLHPGNRPRLALHGDRGGQEEFATHQADLYRAVIRRGPPIACGPREEHGVNGQSVVPQWLFLYGTMILYLLIGTVVFVLLERRARMRRRR